MKTKLVKLSKADQLTQLLTCTIILASVTIKGESRLNFDSRCRVTEKGKLYSKRRQIGQTNEKKTTWRKRKNNQLYTIPYHCKGCFPLGGIFRAQRNFCLFASSQAELIEKRQRKIALRAENSA